MKLFEEFVRNMETADVGAYAMNLDNGRMVEVTNMCGGRYLCTEHDEPLKQTDNICVAFNFLKLK